MFQRFLFSSLVSSMAAAAVLGSSTLAFAHPHEDGDHDQRQPSDTRPVYDLGAGSRLVVKNDIYIDRRALNAPLENSTTDLFSRCFLQPYQPKLNDRVVRAGRVLKIKRVTVAANFVALSLDDGNEPAVLAQVGCNMNLPVLPLIWDIRQALEGAFDLEVKESPVEEVSLPLPVVAFR